MASYSQSPQSQPPKFSQSTILISVPEYCLDNEHANHAETTQSKQAARQSNQKIQKSLDSKYPYFALNSI